MTVTWAGVCTGPGRCGPSCAATVESTGGRCPAARLSGSCAPTACTVRSAAAARRSPPSPTRPRPGRRTWSTVSSPPSPQPAVGGRLHLFGSARGYVQPGWRCARSGVVGVGATAHNQRPCRKARSRSPGWNRGGDWWGSSSRCRTASLAARSASRYWCVAAGLAWPSHKAITARSVPDCSRCMAVECRRVCGVTRWPCSDGQRCAAMATARSSRSRTPERVSGAPARLGNTGAAGAELIWPSQPRSSVGGVLPERDGPLFAALAVQVHRGTGGPAARHGPADR